MNVAIGFFYRQTFSIFIESVLFYLVIMMIMIYLFSLLHLNRTTNEA